MHERDLTEVQQLLQLGQLEGRNPLLDSFVGMSYDDEIRNDLSNSDMPAEVRKYARDLWDRVRLKANSAAPLATGKPYDDSWRKGTDKYE